MKQAYFILFIMGLTGCLHGKPADLPGEGERSLLVVECLKEEKNCYPEAKRLCPQGYFVRDSKFRAIMNWEGFDVGHTVKYILKIECQDKQ